MERKLNWGRERSAAEYRKGETWGGGGDQVVLGY